MKIVITYFLLSLLLTIFVLYMIAPEPEIVVKYPDISKNISDVYVDTNGVCYRYHRIEVNGENNK